VLSTEFNNSSCKMTFILKFPRNRKVTVSQCCSCFLARGVALQLQYIFTGPQTAVCPISAEVPIFSLLYTYSVIFVGVRPYVRKVVDSLLSASKHKYGIA
jgi:hypothetical protein